jgi:hypothetical protein
VELAFSSKQLRQLCEVAASGDEQLGPLLAKSLRDRLADIAAAESVADLLIGFPTLNIGRRELTLRLAEDARLVFAVNQGTLRADADLAGPDEVVRLKLLRVERDNDNL